MTLDSNYFSSTTWSHTSSILNYEIQCGKTWKQLENEYSPAVELWHLENIPVSPSQARLSSVFEKESVLKQTLSFGTWVYETALNDHPCAVASWSDLLICEHIKHTHLRTWSTVCVKIGLCFDWLRVRFHIHEKKTICGLMNTDRRASWIGVDAAKLTAGPCRFVTDAQTHTGTHVQSDKTECTSTENPPQSKICYVISFCVLKSKTRNYLCRLEIRETSRKRSNEMRWLMTS